MRKFAFIPCVFVIYIFSSISCGRSSNRELVTMLKQWIGKEIIISEIEQFDLISGDTVKQDSSKGYIIIHCVDSVGCTSCNLKLSLWKSFINDINKVSKETVSLVFVSNSKGLDLNNLVMPSSKLYVVDISKDSLCLLHELFDNKYFNTILLDRNNRVVTVGNPILTPKIMNNYYRAVMH